MSGRVHLSVFGAGGRAGGDIIQVFEYDYFGVRTETGWTVERRAFNGLQKL